MPKIKRPFNPKQTVRVRAQQPVTSLDGTLTLKPGQCIMVFALRFLKAVKAWVVRLQNGFEFLAHHFVLSASRRRRPKRKERLMLRPAYSFR